MVTVVVVDVVAVLVDVVVGVSRQAHHRSEDAVRAHERVREVCVLVYLKLASVKRFVPAEVASETAVVVSGVAAVHLTSEVTGRVRVVAHTAQH
mgnify:CR=1 FL=1